MDIDVKNALDKVLAICESIERNNGGNAKDALAKDIFAFIRHISTKQANERFDYFMVEELTIVEAPPAPLWQTVIMMKDATNSLKEISDRCFLSGKVDEDIRADSIATIVEMELRRLADYLVDDTERFAEILAKKSTKEWESEKKAAQGELTKAEMRIDMIPKLLKKLYEDNLSGKTSDDDYSILSQEYSVERDQLKKKILGLRDKLKGMEDRAGEREAFVKAIRKFMSMKTLTAPLLRELIDHIDVYEVEGQGKNKTQRVVIYYKFVGYLEIPNDLSRPTYSADLREGVSVEYITCEAGEDILDEEAWSR